MLIAPDTRTEVGRLADKLRGATEVSVELFAAVFIASPRLATLRATGKTGRLERLVASEAWTDAAIELIALELPEWSVQRLCRDDGEWLCTLTRFPDLPEWLDDSAEGRRPALALAILDAFLAARVRSAVTSPPGAWQLSGVHTDCTDYR